MYSSFYGFDQEPFNVTPDSDFIYYSEQHKEALAHMLYGVQERKGFIVVTGRVGSGKTTLCRAFMKELDEDTSTALVLNSKMTAQEILEAIAEDFGLEVPDNPSTKDIIDRLNQFVLDEYREGRNVCVIIDESQNLSAEALENLRLLSNLETEKEKLLQMVLVGQPELNTLLNKEELRQLKQRISVRAYLSNLTDQETRDYVHHRLELADPRQPIEIKDEVLDHLHEMSAGNPRAINLIMDRTLLAAYVDDAFVIERKHIDKAIDELSQEVIEQEGKDARVLHRIRSDEDEVTITIPNVFGDLDLSEVSENWIYGVTTALVTFTVVAGGIWFTQSGVSENGQQPVISQKIADKAGVTPDTATALNDAEQNETEQEANGEAKETQQKKGKAETGSIPQTSQTQHTQSTQTSQQPDSTRETPSTPQTTPEESTPKKQSSTPQTQGSQENQSTENDTVLTAGEENTTEGETTTEDDEEGTSTQQPQLTQPTQPLVEGRSSNPEITSFPNPLDINPPETQKRLEVPNQFGAYSLARYVSLKIQTKSNLPSGLPEPPLSELNGQLSLEQLVPDPLPGHLLDVTEKDGRPQTYGFPGFLEWGRSGETKRYALLLPYQAQIWDPFNGWMDASNQILSSYWNGEGKYLVNTAIDPTTTYTRRQVNPGVTEIQRLLNETIDAGLPLVGRYGPRTEKNIREFQRKFGLGVDGIAGPRTTLALMREAGKSNRWTAEDYEAFIRKVEADVVLD